MVLPAGVIWAGALERDAPAAKAVPTKTAARVSIEARPHVAVRVYMNGREVGTTPIRRLPIRPGRYVFEAVRPDGVRLKRIVRFRPAEIRSFVLVD